MDVIRSWDWGGYRTSQSRWATHPFCNTLALSPCPDVKDTYSMLAWLPLRSTIFNPHLTLQGARLQVATQPVTRQPTEVNALRSIEVLVLDEADRLLDPFFIHKVHQPNCSSLYVYHWLPQISGGLHFSLFIFQAGGAAHHLRLAKRNSSGRRWCFALQREILRLSADGDSAHNHRSIFGELPITWCHTRWAWKHT